MPFDEMLARCLEGLEQGRMIDECLADYPYDAEELKPLLYVAAHLRNSPSPGLSAAAFARGRAAVAAQASYQRRLLTPFLKAEVNLTPLAPVPAPALPPRPFLRRPAPTLRWNGVLIMLLLLLTMVTLSRNIQASLPNSPLYTAKRIREDVQTFLMAAAGQEALGQARQVKQRLLELEQLARQGDADPTLLALVDQKVQATLSAAATMTPAERSEFFAQWLTELHGLQPATITNPAPAMTLRRVLATVQAAADEPASPTVLAPGEFPNEPPTTTATPVASFTPTLANASGAITSPTATPTPRLSATASATVLKISSPTPEPPSPTATPSFTVTPKPTPVIVNGSNNMSNPPEQPKPTATATRRAPTATMVIVPTATWTPLPTATATPTATLIPPSATSTLTPTLTLSATLTTVTPTVIASATFTATTEPTETAWPTATTWPTETIWPTATPLPSPTPTATPILEATPTNATPEPTPTWAASPTDEATAVVSTPTFTPTFAPVTATILPVVTDTNTPTPSPISPDDDPATSTPGVPNIDP